MIVAQLSVVDFCRSMTGLRSAVHATYLQFRIVFRGPRVSKYRLTDCISFPKVDVVINQLLNRDFVLDQLASAASLTLPADERRRGAAIPPEANQVSEEDQQSTLADVERVLAAESLESSGQSPFLNDAEEILHWMIGPS